MWGARTANVDYWKLLRAFEKIADSLPGDRFARVSSQVRFSAARLDDHLLALAIELLAFDGAPISSSMPVAAINADEVSGLADVIIASTLEPAVVTGTRIISHGRVVAAVRSE